MSLYSPNKKKRLRPLHLSEKPMDIDEMLYLASRKLNPIIEMLVDSCNTDDHFLTIQEFDDAILASKLIKDVSRALEYSSLKTSPINLDFTLENYQFNVNDQGKIFVETVLLIQLIDLYNTLEDIKDIMDEYYRSIGIHSFVQTDSSLSIGNEEGSNPNKIVLRLTKPLTKSSTSFGLLQNNFIVMPSITDINSDENYNEAETLPLKESKSQVSSGSKKITDESSTKKIKSTGSIGREETSEVTDVYGAKRVVVKCIYDLQEVGKYLGTERKDVATICSRVEVENLPDSSTRRKSDGSARSNHSERPVHQPGGTHEMNDIHESNGEHPCCCPDCFAKLGSKADLQECDDDKIIICIKGCNEDEGDVQIVIRQCPDCKKAEEPSHIQPDKTIPPNVSKSKQSTRSEPKPKSKTDESIKSPNKEMPTTVIHKTEDSPEKSESASLHNKDSEGSVICSDETDEEKVQKESVPLQKTFKEEPTSPRSPPSPLESLNETEHIDSKPNNLQHQARVSCSKIRLFETTNLCLQTDTGQELVISLTVTPKGLDNRKLSLRDIFSEDEYSYQEQKPNIDQLSIGSAGKSSLKQRGSRGSQGQGSFKQHQSNENHDTKSVSLREPDSYYVKDQVIPLGRTKICSSMDFDVTAVESTMRDKGLHHKNAKIVVQLQDLGINNLLRACRPAKCCRKAVLNEKLKKCLPYPPSLRSLPLDNDDIDIINQSLQMSLQKVKNSTNLTKDFLTNRNYTVKPIHTIMYFFVENSLSKENLKSVCSNSAVREKLSYYINLVNDIGFRPKLNYDIFYFDMEQKLNKDLTQVVKKCLVNENQNRNNNRLLNVGIVEVIPNHTWVRQRFNEREETPIFNGLSSIEQKSSSLASHNRIRIHSGMNNSLEIKGKNKKLISKIPIYHGNCKQKHSNLKSEYNIEQVEQEVFGISLESLPREDGFVNNSLLNDIGPESSLSSKNKPSDEHKSDNQNIDQSKGIREYVMSQCSSRNKRKKKIFYLSRSKSDISIKSLKNKSKLKAINNMIKLSKEIVDTYSKESEKDERSTTDTETYVKDTNSSKIILNYFSKMLYEMIIKESLKEQAVENIISSKPTQGKHSTTEKSSLYEIYKKVSSKNTERVDNLKMGQFTNPSCYDLKAKKSQSCILITSKQSRQKVCIVNNLALQTSILFGDSKQCQTSESLLAYLINSKTKSDEKNLQKRIFKNIYNSEALTGIRNSCDEFENFIVVFKSDHSLKLNFSEKDFLSSASEQSERSFENAAEQTISNSLLKLKETLEKYETVKNEITQGSLQEANVNPIEYFVYQTCACNKFNKKPSVMQKIFSKTKGIFSSVEHDMSKKYRNQRKFFSLSSSDRQRLCHQCGCYIDKCAGNVTPDKTISGSSTVCQCPSENRPNKAPYQPCCRKQRSSYFKADTNLSKITSISKSSIKSLKTCFQKSFSSLRSRSKDKGLGPCSCDKQTMVTKNAKTAISTVCIPEGVTTVICNKKDTSTATVKDSTTQKCECEKCENFCEDGTCCCSHCLGCLDKSCGAKPNNSSVGTLCKCSQEKLSKVNSTESGKAVDIKQNKSLASSDNMDSNTEKNQNLTADKTASRNTINSVASNKSLPPEKSSSKNDEKIEEDIHSSNTEDTSNNNNNNTTALYVLTSPPNIFSQLGYTSRNPFEQYASNFPHVNVFRIGNSQSFTSE